MRKERREMLAKRMSWVKGASTALPVIDRPSVVLAGEPFELKFSFGADAFYVRWISVYFFENGEEDPHWLGGFKVGDDMKVTPVDGTIVQRSKDTFILRTSLRTSGVIRTIVLYEDRGLWEYSKEIEVEAAEAQGDEEDRLGPGVHASGAPYLSASSGRDEDKALDLG